MTVVNYGSGILRAYKNSNFFVLLICENMNLIIRLVNIVTLLLILTITLSGHVAFHLLFSICILEPCQQVISYIYKNAYCETAHCVW